MNKLIIGLSCLSVLSTVSCDNEHNDKINLPLEKVNFSVNGVSENDANAAAALTLADGDKVTLYIEDGGNAAKYYTDSDRSGEGTDFPKGGKEFTIDANKSIKGGFYLQSVAGNGKAYTLKKFNISKKIGGNNYVLKKDLPFNVKTGKPNTVSVVELGSNLVDIPDDNFRAYLKKKIPNDFHGDKMYGYSFDVQNLSIIDVDSLDIQNLKGIEYFTGLNKLYCNYNKLDSLDLSNNTALTLLYCFGNQLTSLDLTKNTALTILYCFGNQLTSLDLTKNTALTELNCGHNKLNSLNVSNNTALTILYCNYNKLNSLNVSNNKVLTQLDCFGNQLTSLDLTKNTALTFLDCNYNKLNSLDLTKNTALTFLDCSYNKRKSLDLTKNTALTALICSYNKLKSLDLTKNTALTTLICSYNKLKSLDLSHNCKLKIINADHTVNIKYCPGHEPSQQ